MNNTTQIKLHNIRNKAILGIKLTKKEECFYLLYCNSITEIKEFKQILRQNQEINNCGKERVESCKF